MDDSGQVSFTVSTINRDVMSGNVTTTVEVDRDLWLQFKSEAALHGRTVTEQMNVVLSERYDE